MSLLIWFSHCLIVLPWRKVGKAKVNYFQATSKLFQISDDHLLTKMFAWVGSSGGSLCFTAGRGVEPKFPHETTKIPALTHFKVNTSRLRCSVIWGELSWVEIWRGERGKAEISSMGPDLYHIKKKKRHWNHESFNSVNAVYLIPLGRRGCSDKQATVHVLQEKLSLVVEKGHLN